MNTSDNLTPLQFLQQRLSFLWEGVDPKKLNFHTGTPWMGVKSVTNGSPAYFGIMSGSHVFADEENTQVWMSPGNLLPVEQSVQYGVVLSGGSGMVPDHVPGFRRIVFMPDTGKGVVNFKFQQKDATMPYADARDWMTENGFEVVSTGFTGFVRKLVAGAADIKGRAVIVSSGKSSKPWDNLRYSDSGTVAHVGSDGGVSIYRREEISRFIQSLRVAPEDVRENFTAVLLNKKNHKTNSVLDNHPFSRYLQQILPAGSKPRSFIVNILRNGFDESPENQE